MRISVRVGALSLGLAAAVALGVLPLAAQEPEAAPSRPAAKAADTAAPKKAADPSRRVPNYFGQVGLTTEQKEEIYRVRARHQERIDALQKQLTEARARMMTECEAVLNPSQRQMLDAQRETAAQARKAKAQAAGTPATPVTPATPPRTPGLGS